MTDKFRILSIDGGGIKGLYSMYRLKYIEDKYCKPNGKLLNNYFDMICGCSIGSIIAVGISLKIPMNEIIATFEQNVKKIFPGHDGCGIKKSYYNIKQLFGYKYDKKVLEDLLKKYVQDKTMADVYNNLCIPSFNLSKSQNIVFKNMLIEAESYSNSNLDIKLRDIIMASCAAPTYFSPHKINDDYYIDGGIWANNPATIGIIEAMEYFVGPDKNYSSYTLLSVGNLHIDPIFKIKKPSKFFRVTEIERLIGIIFNASSDSSIYYSRRLDVNTNGKTIRLINNVCEEGLIDDSSDKFLSKIINLANTDNYNMSKDMINDIEEIFKRVDIE